MKFYLSSYRVGNAVERLRTLVQKNDKKTGYISNAIDFTTDLEKRRQNEKIDIDALLNLGLEVEHIDLRNYFGQEDRLNGKISEFGLIWISGGSVFVLREAMKRSGLDKIVKDMLKQEKEIIYGGYSAGVCVLAPTLKGIHLMDEPTLKPYGDSETIWEGLGILDYLIVPHYKSDHPESKDADRVVEYMINNKLLFKVLTDGEVLIIE